MDEKTFRDLSVPFISSFDAFVAKADLKGLARADHICWKCATSQEFAEMRSLFEDIGVYIHQTLISGRRIATVRLRVALPSSLGPLTYVELSDQKPDGSQVSGFDHIEIFPLGRPLSTLSDRAQERGFVPVPADRPHHPTVDIKLPGLIVRFEPEPLIEKIERELI